MNLDSYSQKRGMFKMLGGAGLLVAPLLIVLYMGPHSLSGVEAGPVRAPDDVEPPPTIEQSTRAIFFEDLDEAWEHYETGEYSEAMWKQVYAHVIRNWSEQAQGKGWSEFGWAPPNQNDPPSTRRKNFTTG